MLLTVTTLVVSVAPPSHGQATGSIRGRVITPFDRPAADAEVRVPDLGRRVAVDEDGRFVFDGIAAGRYLLEINRQRSGRAVERVVVQEGRATELTITLTPVFHLEELVVSAGAAQQRSETYQATDVLSGQELAERAAATLGETLNGQPGINSTSFGPGASRPIIRGLGGDRVRVLDNGVTTGDASTTSPDHAVSIEAQTSERIEVIRGPATLLYGSSAIGGVVNVLDNSIPAEQPTRPLSGKLFATGGTVANERNGSLELTAAAGNLIFHGNGLRRETDDYNVPGAQAPLVNSAVATTDGGVGVSYVGERGYLGASWSGLGTDYGLPSEEEVTINLDQLRYDVEGALRFRGGAIRNLSVRLGISDYEHEELEGSEVGTQFLNNEWEGRVEAQTRFSERIHGAVGVQVGNRDFSAIGEEAFVPPTATTRWAAFLFEEFDAGQVRYQLGARFERQNAKNEIDNVEIAADGFSVSGGINWTPIGALGFAVSVARSVKLPSPEELYSDGPHLATQAFEVGDPTLDMESAVSVDAGIRLLEGGPVSGEFDFFVNSFDDFIYEAFTGEEEDGLRVLQFTQADALFLGFEAYVDVALYQAAYDRVVLEMFGDYVRAELTATDEPLPRIPPLRVGSALRYDGDRAHGRVAVRRVTAQERTAAFEDPTDGYTMVEASVGYRIFTGGVTHEITVRGANLADELARNHVSFLKEIAPLPGREVRVTYQLSF